MAKTLTDCQHDAVVLASMIEGIDLMGYEGERFENARVAVTMAALQIAKQLAEGLERLNSKAREE